ncbi:hypothetical protein GOODEAATRI_032794, partial [Goodea atripinnis]
KSEGTNVKQGNVLLTLVLRQFSQTLKFLSDVASTQFPMSQGVDNTGMEMFFKRKTAVFSYISLIELMDDKFCRGKREGGSSKWSVASSQVKRQVREGCRSKWCQLQSPEGLCRAALWDSVAPLQS